MQSIVDLIRRMNLSMRKKIFLTVSICSCLIFAFLNIRLFWELDFIMDTSLKTISNYIWFLRVGLISCILLTIINVKSKEDIIVCFSILVMVMLLLFSVFSRPNFEELLFSQSTDGNIADIDWNTFQEFKNSDVYYLIYVGRDDCPDCEVFRPKLEKVLQENEISGWYYNTSIDREKEGFQEKMDSIGVRSVPALLIAGNGKIEIVEDVVLESEESLNKFLLENNNRLE